MDIFYKQVNKATKPRRMWYQKGKLSILLCVSMLFLGACSTYTKQSYTFALTTGNRIEVELKTNDGYELLQDGGRFQIKENDVAIMDGMFVSNTVFAKEYDALRKEDMTSVLQEDVKDGNSYALLERTIDSITGYYYIIEMKDSDVGIILDTRADKDKAKEVFDRLEFTLE